MKVLILRRVILFKNLDDFLNCTDSKLSLLQESFKAFKSSCLDVSLLGDWSLRSESPAGSGLGGSSSLLISILKVLSELLSVPMNENEMVTWAKNIETRVLKKPAGIQDYYPAIASGLNRISFEPYGESREVLSNTLLEFLNNHLLLIDSQIKHHSGLNNWDIFKRMIDGDKDVHEALLELSRISNDFESVLNSKDVNGLKSLFDRELEARKKVSDLYFTKELKEFCSKLESDKNILSYKICGAGGGGCVLVLCDTMKKSIEASLQESGLSVLPFELVAQ